MTQQLPATLTSVEAALCFLLDGVATVDPIDVTIADAVGGIAAEDARQQAAHPAFAVAVADGWALRARDIAGASSYAPLPMTTAPVWVEAGDRVPDGYDCVLDAGMVEHSGPLFQILAEAIPGAGLRRAGDDIPAGRSVLTQGQPLSAFNRLAARAARIDRVLLRSPRVCVIDVPAADGGTASSAFILEFATAAGARVTALQAAARDAPSVVAAVNTDAYDLVVTVGGTGVGRHDATVAALGARGAELIHGLASQPGRTAAVGKIGSTPVIAAPGAPDQALAACLMLVQPVLDRLTARPPRPAILRPLARKISSSVGIAEVVLLETLDEAWMPIAVGCLSLDTIARADAWLVVPADSEGYAAATTVSAFPLRVIL